jgi:HPt (histidine-containing phosphotransfer) domain-containing protein
VTDEDDEDRAAIRELYAVSQARLLDRVGAVEAAVAGLASGGLSTATRTLGAQEAHKLAGSLGTFGVPAGSTLAKELELLLEGDPGAADVPQATELAAALRATVEAGPA